MNSSKTLIRLGAGLVTLCLTAAVAPAWHVSGKVVCDADASKTISAPDTPVQNVTVVVTNAGGTLMVEAATNADGTFNIELPHTPDSYHAYLRPASLPADATVLLPAGGMHAFALKDGVEFDRFEAANFLLKCATEPAPTPEPEPSGVGARSPGYWMNHPDAWPEDSITIGDETYTKSEAIAMMKKKGGGDQTLILFFHLVAAKLNLLAGTEDDCIEDTVEAADVWLSEFTVGSNVRANSAAWKTAEKWKDMLDAYNNGQLCAPKAK